MTERELVTCMRDLAEFGWVVLSDPKKLAGLEAALSRLQLAYSVQLVNGAYMVRQIEPKRMFIGGRNS